MEKFRKLSKAFFINGGAGRVVCSIPALERYASDSGDDDFIIISESWQELYQGSAPLRDRVYAPTHKDLFKDHLKDKEVVSPEPYRLNAYFNQKANLVQAFDVLINDLDCVPDLKVPHLELSKTEQITGHNIVNEVKEVTGCDKVVVFQPFGQSVQVEGKFIFDTSGRSFEITNVVEIIQKLKENNYGTIVMSQIEIPSWQDMGIAMPKNLNLLGWSGVIKAADYFLGCDSVGQHLAVAVQTSATVVLGSTYPENISYPDTQGHTIIDLGYDKQNDRYKRNYSPIRLTMDESTDRSNEDCMIVNPGDLTRIIKTVTDSIGVGKRVESTTPSYMQAPPNIPGTSPQTPKIPKITKSGQSITKKLLTPPKQVAGFNKPKIAKKKPIDKLVEMELNKDTKVDPSVLLEKPVKKSDS